MKKANNAIVKIIAAPVIVASLGLMAFSAYIYMNWLENAGRFPTTKELKQRTVEETELVTLPENIENTQPVDDSMSSQDTVSVSGNSMDFAHYNITPEEFLEGMKGAVYKDLGEGQIISVFFKKIPSSENAADDSEEVLTADYYLYYEHVPDIPWYRIGFVVDQNNYLEWLCIAPAGYVEVGDDLLMDLQMLSCAVVAGIMNDTGYIPNNVAMDAFDNEDFYGNATQMGDYVYAGLSKKYLFMIESKSYYLQNDTDKWGVVDVTGKYR